MSSEPQENVRAKAPVSIDDWIDAYQWEHNQNVLLHQQKEDMEIELMWRRDQLCFLQAAITRIEKIAANWRQVGMQRACNHICEISGAAFDLVDVVAESEGKETPELTLEREWFMMLIQGVLDTVDPVDDISRN